MDDGWIMNTVADEPQGIPCINLAVTPPTAKEHWITQLFHIQAVHKLLSATALNVQLVTFTARVFVCQDGSCTCGKPGETARSRHAALLILPPSERHLLAVTAFGQPGIAAANSRVNLNLPFGSYVQHYTTHFWSYWGWFRVLGSHTSGRSSIFKVDVRPKQSASNTFSFEYHRQSNFLHSEIHPINKHVICSNSEKNKKVLHLRTWQFHCEMVGFCRFPKKSNHSPILIPFLFQNIWLGALCANSGAVPPPHKASAPRELHLGRLFVCPHWFNGYPVCQNAFSTGIQWVSKDGRSINPTFESYDFVFLPQSTCSLSGKTTVSCVPKIWKKYAWSLKHRKFALDHSETL